MTDEDQELSPVVKSVVYIAESLTDNSAWFACLAYALYLILVGVDVPEWLIAIIGMGATKYLKV